MHNQGIVEKTYTEAVKCFFFKTNDIHTFLSVLK